MEIKNQIILNDNGNSWKGFHSSNEKITQSLNEIKNCIGRTKNNFWVLDKLGNFTAAQPKLRSILKYCSDEHILVHTEKYFIHISATEKSLLDARDYFSKYPDAEFGTQKTIEMIDSTLNNSNSIFYN